MSDRLYMFDFDGVIADSLDAFHSAMEEDIVSRGILLSLTRREFLRVFDENMTAGLLGLGMTREQIETFLARLPGQLLPAMQKIEVFDGVHNALHELKKHGDLVLITSNVSAVVSTFLRERGLRDCFQAVLGSDVNPSKVEKISQTVFRFGAQFSYYVGDTAGDMIEARMAGVRSVAACWGWHREHQLRDAGADILVRMPADLVDALVADCGNGRYK